MARKKCKAPQIFLAVHVLASKVKWAHNCYALCAASRLVGGEPAPKPPVQIGDKPADLLSPLRGLPRRRRGYCFGRFPYNDFYTPVPEYLRY
jgi:hypothetical protein